MANAEKLITENLGLWSSAIKKKSRAGRGSTKKLELFGIQKLRRLILKLAIDGLLVKQDEREEPAFKQLERIETQKATGKRARRSNKNRIKTEYQESKSDPLPTGWSKTTLDSLVTVLNGRAYKKDELLNSGTPVLRVGNLFTSSHWYYSDLELEDDKYCKHGDLIFAWSASFGPFIWDGPKAIFHYHIWKLLPHKEGEISKHFLFRILEEKTEEIKNSGHGVAMIHMTKAKMEKLNIRLPPLAEQHRIVAKVDELMALCDQLEEEQETNLETHKTLVGTLLNSLTAAADASQFADAWQHIQENFDILFTTESSVDQLKQTILQLAVIGKLVRQDSDDESAALNLRTLKAKQLAMFADEKLRKRKAIQPQNRNDWQYEIPTNWAFSNFEEVSVIVSGATKGRKLSGRKTRRLPYLRVANVQRHYLDLEVIKDIEVLDEDLESYKLVTGDVLMTEGGDWDKLGRAAIWQDEIKDCIHQNHIYRVRSADKDILLPKWIELFANSPPGRRFFESASKQTTNLASINMTQLRGCPLPLPPTKEQHRIVAKVDALFTLCDHLKTRLHEAQETQLTLADSISEQAIQSPA